MIRKHLYSAILLTNVMGISGCDGSDGGVNSIATAPPPAAPSPAPAPAVALGNEVAPLSATPSMTASTYSTIALVERHSGAPGWALESLEPTVSPDQVQIMVEPSSKTFTVLIDPAISPYTQTVFTPQSPTITATAPGEEFHHQLIIGPGLSHVSFGAWSGFTISTRPDGTSFSKDDPTFMYFVYGDRTSPTDIPVSGMATYAAKVGWSDMNGGGFGVPDFTLTADFGGRSISALFDVLPILDSDWYGGNFYSLGFHASGTAPIKATGDFDIALVGTLTSKSVDASVADKLMPMTGMVNGGFFGPEASQIGGVLKFTAEDFWGAKTVGGNFVGEKH
ncbi:hypothetical protein [Sphingobium sp. EM0848]|uniref:hypothetical protein n=1 Tax=Sphingobium sp. EM0848 TaxID=2743473 RepID=UPI00159C1619|nr:hypothetical protein [Sphingobium sp. EM0848]